MIDIAAIVVVWGYILGFLYLTARTARRSGKPVWLFSAGRERQTVPAMLFRTAFVLGGILPLITMWAEATGSPNTLTKRLGADETVAVAGLLMAAVGAALAHYAQNYMGNSWRIGAAQGQLGAIVSGGPFAYSRNPVFVGQIALFCGLALVYPTLAQLTVALAIVAAAKLQVRVEERVLAHDLGEAYVSYCRQVRRWL